MRLSAVDAPPRLHGLPPIIDERSRVLILGSFPSDASLRRGEYYAHPRNQFWPIMAELFGINHPASYEERVEGLLGHRIALWDVIRECAREGSADQAIRDLEANALIELLAEHQSIVRIAFNGTMAEDTARKTAPELFRTTGVLCQRMPSTSPAHAGMPFASKVGAWSRLREWTDRDG